MSLPKAVLVVDENVEAATALARALTDASPPAFEAVASSLEDAVRAANGSRVAAVVLNLDGSTSSGGLDALLRSDILAPVVVIVPASREDLGLSSIRLGADDYAVSGHQLAARVTDALARAGARSERARQMRTAATRESQKRQATMAVTSTGALVTGLGHEINNPLAVILANVEEAARVTSELGDRVGNANQSAVQDVRDMLDEAMTASQRIQTIVRELRPFSRSDTAIGRVDLNRVVESCCHIAYAEIRHRAKLVKELGVSVPILASESLLAHVVFQVLVNAAHALPDGLVDQHEIRVVTRQIDEKTVGIEVRDSGAGFDPQHIRRAFEPGFSTKPGHPGFGLTVSQAIVDAHGGTMTIERPERGGTLVQITLPIRDSEAESPGTPERRARVLVVDDDPLVLRSLVRALSRDFDVSSAKNGREALELIHGGEPLDALLCDLIMPDLSGMDLFDTLRRKGHTLADRTVFLTGASFTEQAQRFLEKARCPCFDKPADTRAVVEVLRSLCPASVLRA